ncbi:hypothetical protein FBR07_00055 [Candidatus Uhrbacteria bacterium UHB]|jgi:transcriptional regulator of heat shock response|nr:hypothetical protein [Candidatus Uhrbacteria bacterium UHB]RIL00331.1 MAG: hypothetical protein DCC77_02060 [Candidatus Uhrbacteria bacterium]
MDARLEQVLSHLIEDYIRSAEPVASANLVRSHDLDVSSATIRNWLSLLEEEGYLIQPHTSAGRIPSERAFRWYAKNRLGGAALPEKYISALSQAAHAAVLPERAKQLAKCSVAITKSAALVGTNLSDTYYTGLSELFSQPEFRDWSRVVSIGSMLDRLDEQLNRLREQSYAEPRILLGSECPFGNACGSVLLTLPKRMVFVLLGPIRMDYKTARNVSYEISRLMHA